MEVKNNHLLIGFLCLLGILGFTLYEINNFMPIIASCEDDIAVIDKCGCDIWGVTGIPAIKINISEGSLPNG